MASTYKRASKPGVKTITKPAAPRPTGREGVQSNAVIGNRRSRTIDDVVSGVSRGDEVKERDIIRR